MFSPRSSRAACRNCSAIANDCCALRALEAASSFSNSIRKVHDRINPEDSKSDRLNTFSAWTVFKRCAFEVFAVVATQEYLATFEAFASLKMTGRFL
jgi:hypothetical protein